MTRCPTCGHLLKYETSKVFGFRVNKNETPEVTEAKIQKTIKKILKYKNL